MPGLQESRTRACHHPTAAPDHKNSSGLTSLTQKKTSFRSARQPLPVLFTEVPSTKPTRGKPHSHCHCQLADPVLRAAAPTALFPENTTTASSSKPAAHPLQCKAAPKVRENSRSTVDAVGALRNREEPAWQDRAPGTLQPQHQLGSILARTKHLHRSISLKCFHKCICQITMESLLHNKQLSGTIPHGVSTHFQCLQVQHFHS